jgi:23S rRNA (cytosine1962-C5)-methyltransferase
VTDEPAADASEADETATLVDFGGGRRLERLGGVLVDRPHPAATGSPLASGAWSGAHLRYEEAGWACLRPLPRSWVARVSLPAGRLTRSLALHLRPAPSGQVGLFLEHVEAARWLAAALEPGDRVLSLFAHTGIATLAAAAAGALVTHVDSSRQALRTARDNAATSGLADAGIRWIHDDCATFVARLARRGERFTGLVLDPPSWGHGPKGQAFSIEEDLPDLLTRAAGLVDPSAAVVLLTAHTPGWVGDRLAGVLSPLGFAAASRARVESGTLACEDERGRRLCLGHFARLDSRRASHARA